jgi:hypothetical protein
MRFRQSPEDQQAEAITRLVDDAAVDTDASEAWADRPELRREVDAQRRVVRALRTGGPAVPDHLVQTLGAKVHDAYGAEPPRPRRARAGWWPTVAAAGIAAVCAAIVIAVGLGGGSSRPSIPAAAELAFSPSTGPAPAVKNATYLDVSYGGVTFPNYQKLSVPPTGQRTDKIGGRSALTVFYRLPDGTPLSYTVFSGTAVPRPSNVKSVVFEGVPLHYFTTSSGLSVVTLVRYGRTCVLAAKTKLDVVLGLAAAPVFAQRAAA